MPRRSRLPLRRLGVVDGAPRHVEKDDHPEWLLGAHRRQHRQRWLGHFGSLQAFDRHGIAGRIAGRGNPGSRSRCERRYLLEKITGKIGRHRHRLNRQGLTLAITVDDEPKRFPHVCPRHNPRERTRRVNRDGITGAGGVSFGQRRYDGFDLIARRDARLRRRAPCPDPGHFHRTRPRFAGGRTHRHDAEQRSPPRRQCLDKRDLHIDARRRSRLLTFCLFTFYRLAFFLTGGTFDAQPHGIARVAWRKHMAEFRDPRHGPTIRGDDQIARPQPRLRRRRSRPTCGDPGLAGERIPRAVPDAQHTRRQRLPIFQSRQHAEHVLERHCEADTRVVEFRAQIHARGVGRQRGENADGPAPDVDERSAIVGRRDRGIGLHGAAPRPIRGGQDAHGHTGDGAVPGTPHRDRPLSNRQFGPRRPLGHRRWRLIDPQQDEPAG